MMYLESFRAALTNGWTGGLFRVRDVEKVYLRAKEYLHRLSKKGVVRRVGWAGTTYQKSTGILGISWPGIESLRS